MITNKENEVIMKGVRSKDNCYMWSSQETEYSSMCTLAKEEEVKIWHQRLGHPNSSFLKVLSSKNVLDVNKWSKTPIFYK